MSFKVTFSNSQFLFRDIEDDLLRISPVLYRCYEIDQKFLSVEEKVKILASLTDCRIKEEKQKIYKILIDHFEKNMSDYSAFDIRDSLDLHMAMYAVLLRLVSQVSMSVLTDSDILELIHQMSHVVIAHRLKIGLRSVDFYFKFYDPSFLISSTSIDSKLIDNLEEEKQEDNGHVVISCCKVSEISPQIIYTPLKAGSKEVKIFDLDDQISKTSGKQMLHEFLQKKHVRLPSYKTFQTGSNHNPKFGCICSVVINTEEILCKVKALYANSRDAENASASDMFFKLQEKVLDTHVNNDDIVINYKGQLQEYGMKNGGIMPDYQGVTIGPQYDPKFVCTLKFKDKVVKSEAYKRKDAQQEAARLMLELLGVLTERVNVKGQLQALLRKFGHEPQFKYEASGPYHDLQWVSYIDYNGKVYRSGPKSTKRKSEEDVSRVLYDFLINDKYGPKEDVDQQVILDVINEDYVKYLSDEDEGTFWVSEESVDFDDPLEKIFVDNVFNESVEKSGDQDYLSDIDDSVGDEVLFSPGEFNYEDKSC